MRVEVNVYENKYPFKLKDSRLMMLGSKPFSEYIGEQLQAYIKGQVTKIELVRPTEHFRVWKDDGTITDEKGNSIYRENKTEIER